MNSYNTNSPNPVVLFDGVCGLCEWSVQFIIHHDPAGRFRFAPLQSEIARRLLSQYHLDPGGMNTLVLFDESGAHVRSAATIRICLLLEGRFTLLGEFLAMIPEPLRDAAYNWIARNRYRFFGQRDACRLPTPDVAGRFLAA